MRTKALSPKYAALAERIEARLGGGIERLATTTGELGYVVDAGSLVDHCKILRDEEPFRFEVLVDLCGVDYLHYGRDEWDTRDATGTGFSRAVVRGAGDTEGPPEGAGVEASYAPKARFAAVYHLLSLAHNHRLRLKVFCPDDARPILPSVQPVWTSADWYEREAFDLFGILFRGHPDLRRLLTDYGFIGHPFRKDFPLIGNLEMRYDPEKGRVVYEPVSIEPRTLVPKVIRDDNRYEPDLKDGPSA
jgi:NADH-quinone oxidoreductase subunit C